MYGYPYLHKPVQTDIRTEKTTHEKARIHYFANKILNSADMQILLNPKYENLRPFVTALSDVRVRQHGGKVLHDGRNRIELFDVEGMEVVVKSYNRMTMFNRMIYGTLRKSKAMRAYEHARRLHGAGIDTPEEIATVEVRRHGIMRQCIFVSRYSDYLPLRPVTENFTKSERDKAVLDALAKFLVKLHRAGILHNDLNIDNILYKETVAQDGTAGYRFQLIDINRMTFGRQLSVYRRMDNLRRLSCNVPAYLYILGKYAEAMNTDTEYILLKGTLKRFIFEWRKRTEHKIKDIVRVKK